MTPDNFWLVIERARQRATTDAEIPILLQAHLAEQQVPYIVAFEEQLRARFHEAYDAKLWAAATIIVGFCSDDSFTDFRGWLIAQGIDVFMAALQDADRLAELGTFTGDYGTARLFSLCYTPTRVYRQKIGDKIADIPVESIRPEWRHADMLKWNRQQILDSFPRLAERFSG